MKIGLIDIDGHSFPNLALMKIASYHKSIGDEVEMATIGHYDRCYASKLFSFSDDIQNSLISYDEIIKGGTGYDPRIKLPNDIEKCQPDYSIYPMYDFSLQMYSRGCIRKCPFCLVPQKEGKIVSVPCMQLNPKGKHIEVLDNNFFANPNWREAYNHLINCNQKVNMLGIDVRILTEEQAILLNKLKIYKQIYIAWDNPKDDIIPQLELMLKHIKPYKIMCYVLIGYWSTPEEDLTRVMALDFLGIDPFVMPYNKEDSYQKRFARWVNHKATFKSCTFDEYKY